MAVQDEPLSNYESTGIILIQCFFKENKQIIPQSPEILAFTFLFVKREYFGVQLVFMDTLSRNKNIDDLS